VHQFIPLRIPLLLLFSVQCTYFLLILFYLIVVAIVFVVVVILFSLYSLCSVSFVVCAVLCECGVSFCVMCLILVPLPPGKTHSQFK
jgi:hypothetical protein